MTVARVLVVNEDPWAQRMVSAVLVHAGHTVEVVASARAGLAAAARDRPDIVITDTHLPEQDGRSFIAQVRGRPGYERIPAVFLSDPNEAAGVHQPGLDFFIPRQFRVEDLEMLVRALVSEAFGLTPIFGVPVVGMPEWEGTGAAFAAAPRLAFSGLLDQFGLSSILIVLELERKSGVLTLRSPHQDGHVVLLEGRVVRAATDKAPRLTGAPAVYELLTLAQGRFEFASTDSALLAGEDEIGASTSHLLMEGARRVDEHKHAKHRKH